MLSVLPGVRRGMFGPVPGVVNTYGCPGTKARFQQSTGGPWLHRTPGQGRHEDLDYGRWGPDTTYRIRSTELSVFWFKVMRTVPSSRTRTD
jgi:hypothetical protein